MTELEQWREIESLRAQRDELLAALIDLANPRYLEALYKGEHWAMQATTVAQSAIAKAKGIK